MPDAAFLPTEIGLFVLVAVLLVVTLVDGAYQALTGQPSRIRLERHFFHRFPGTEVDCVRQGASKILYATALLLIEGPGAFIGIRNAANLAGLNAPPFERPAGVLGALTFGVIFGSPLLALVLIGFAYRIGMRVNYRSVEREIPAN
jgi:hypothetical protein